MTEACLMKLFLKLNDTSAVREEQPVIMKLLDLMWGLMQVIPEASLLGFSTWSYLIEPCSEKTGLRGFRPGPTQTGLYSHRIRLEA